MYVKPVVKSFRVRLLRYNDKFCQFVGGELSPKNVCVVYKPGGNVYNIFLLDPLKLMLTLKIRLYIGNSFLHEIR